MKLLRSNLSLGGLYTDANADTANTDDTDDDDNDNDTRRTEHDCIGSLPDEPIMIKNLNKGKHCQPCIGQPPAFYGYFECI